MAPSAEMAPSVYARARGDALGAAASPRMLGPRHSPAWARGRRSPPVARRSPSGGPPSWTSTLGLLRCHPPIGGRWPRSQHTPLPGRRSTAPLAAGGAERAKGLAAGGLQRSKVGQRRAGRRDCRARLPAQLATQLGAYVVLCCDPRRDSQAAGQRRAQSRPATVPFGVAQSRPGWPRQRLDRTGSLRR
jgi:hypothetical protein